MPQKSGAHFFNRTFSQFAELERAVGHADQPVHRQTKMLHDLAHFAIFAFANADDEPNVRALLALDLGFHISLAGIVSFPRALELKEVARMVPLDRLLVETDSPYLAPVPDRGKRNEPAWVARTVERIAAALSDADNLALVEPWLGRDAVIAELPFPRLIDVQLAPGATPISQSVPGFNAEVWFGLLAPAGTPKEVIAKLNDAVNKVLSMPEVQAKFEAAGAAATPSTPEQFAARLAEEYASWGTIVKEANIKGD